MSAQAPTISLLRLGSVLHAATTLSLIAFIPAAVIASLVCVRYWSPTRRSLVVALIGLGMTVGMFMTLA